MKEEYTHIAVILDRTGSMEQIRDDTIGGFNSFLKKQKEESGYATLTLVQFDSQDPYEVIHKFKPVKEIPELNRDTYVPRATTPLLDAMGRGIIDLENSITELKKEDQPSKIIFVVVTDGQENSSREFDKAQIEKMIKEKTEKNNWQFVFLSTDLASIQDARALGIQKDATLTFVKDKLGSQSAWDALSSTTSDYRGSRIGKFKFTEDDRDPDENA